MKKISQYQVTTWRYWRDWSEEWAKLLVASERFNLQGATCHSSNFHTFSIYILYIYILQKIQGHNCWIFLYHDIAGQILWLGRFGHSWAVEQLIEVPCGPASGKMFLLLIPYDLKVCCISLPKLGTLVSQHHHSLSLLDNQTPSERFRQVLDM